MKLTNILFFLCTIFLMLLCSCNELPISDAIQKDNLSKVTVFVVSPNGTDDTENILSAFANAKTTGPGSIVKLTEGTFYTNYILIDDFDGTFMGAGINKTKVVPIASLDFGTPNFDNLPSAANPWPYLFMFNNSKINISKIGFQVTDYQPAQWFIDGASHNELFGMICIAGTIGNSQIDKISIEGAAGTYRGCNLFLGINYQSPLNDPYTMGGIHKLSSSRFCKSVYATRIRNIGNTQFTIGGSNQEGNLCNEVQMGFAIQDVSNSTFEITYNEINVTSYAGIFPRQGVLYGIIPLPPQSCSIYIANNIINASGNADGILLMDSYRSETINCVIKSNIINLNTSYGGIWGLSSDNIIVQNNRISGSGSAGIYAGVNGELTYNWTIIGNNLQDLTPQISQIWLGPGTNNFTVVGGPNKINVIDEGTNNTITGVNVQYGNSPGQNIRQAFIDKREIMEAMNSKN